MIIGPTIDHLRQVCTFFGNNVAGAADFARGLQNYNTSMSLPAAYVVPLDQDAPPNVSMPGYYQVIEKHIGIVVELDATPDRRGQAPAMTYDEIETALFGAMLNWAPEPCRVPSLQGYQFTAGRFLDLDRARLFYRWEFLLPWTVTDEDAWPVDEGVPLRSIEVDIYKAPPWDVPPADGTAPAAVIVLPMEQETYWDDELGGTGWDDLTTSWDLPPPV